MMSSLKQQFLASSAGRWYLSREPGERRIVAALAALVVLSLLWLLVWKPIQDWRAMESNRYRNAQAELDWVRANEGRAREVSRSGGPSPNRSLLPIITRSAEARGIQVNRLQPEANGVVSVAIQGQPFNDLLAWLHQLQENNEVTVLRLAVDADGRPGRVNAQIRLR